FLHRQQHAGLDLDEQGRHEQVFAGQLKVVAPDLLHIRQVLTRDVRHRDVQHVEVLLTDQVKQEVERAFEGFEKDLQRIRRNVKVLRQVEQGLAVQTRQCHGIDSVD